MHSMPARSSRRRSRPRWRATSRSSWVATGTADVWCSSLLEYLGTAGQRRAAAHAAAARPAQSRLWRPPAVLRHRGHRIPLAHRDPRGRHARHQGVPDADRGRHVQPAAVGAVFVRADAVLHLFDQGERPGAAAAAVQSHGQCRRLRGVAGRGAQGRPRCADQQRVRHGRSSFSLQVMADVAGCRARADCRIGPAQGAQRSRRAGAQYARRHRHDGRPRGSGARSRILGAAARKLSVAAAQGADHLAQFRGHGAVSQLSRRPRGRQSLGRGADAARHQRALALLLLAARERSHRSRRRQPQGYRPHLHLRPHRFRQDGLHRLSGRHARAPRTRRK